MLGRRVAVFRDLVVAPVKAQVSAVCQAFASTLVLDAVLGLLEVSLNFGGGCRKPTYLEGKRFVFDLLSWSDCWWALFGNRVLL